MKMPLRGICYTFYINEKTQKVPFHFLQRLIAVFEVFYLPNETKESLTVYVVQKHKNQPLRHILR